MAKSVWNFEEPQDLPWARKIQAREIHEWDWGLNQQTWAVDSFLSRSVSNVFIKKKERKQVVDIIKVLHYV